MDDLVDTTQMYLKSVLELEEEGVPALRARIAERLDQTVPTVSQTVSRMQRDGLLDLAEDRHLEFTPEGRRTAVDIMRKHRLAECLLAEVIGLDWEHLHEEACRWEHVMSDDVEQRLVEVLGHPTHTPYGNPIPTLDRSGDNGLDRSGDNGEEFVDDARGPINLVRFITERGGTVTAKIAWIGEPLQVEPTLLGQLKDAGVLPGATGTFSLHGPEVIVRITDLDSEITLPHTVARHLFVFDVDAQ